MRKLDNNKTIKSSGLKRQSETLVFSIALNGYQWLYPEHLESHRTYAYTHNYDHVLITKPVISKLGMECCWLKLILLKGALQNGYQNVMFVDADAHINQTCPTLNSIYCSNKYLYMAYGYTERFNSGVMIARHSNELIIWLENVIRCRYQDIPTIDSTGWGENGHIIHFSKHVNFIKQLHHRWNNTFDHELSDHIRHFSDGPMRSCKLKMIAHYVLRRVSNLIATYCRAKKIKQSDYTNDILLDEAAQIMKIYPLFKL